MLNPNWFPSAQKTAATPGKFQDGMDYAQRLFHYTYASQLDEVHVLENRMLHRLNIFRLQNELAKLKASFWEDMNASENDLDTLKTTLHDYTNALRDYDYVRSLPEIIGSEAATRRRDLTAAFLSIADLPGDPYNSRYRTFPSLSHPSFPPDPLRTFLKAHLPKRLTYTDQEMHAHIDEYIAGKPPETVSAFVDKLARFIISFTGGASLVVPMLIMRLPTQDTTKSLVVVSVAVTLFACTISLLMRARNTETLVATATYAAVLVVFVGTSS